MLAYALADDAQTLMELGLATITRDHVSPYPHLIPVTVFSPPSEWELFPLPCEDSQCSHTAYRIPDPLDAADGWLLSHEVIQWQPSAVWQALKQWVGMMSEATAVSF